MSSTVSDLESKRREERKNLLENFPKNSIEWIYQWVFSMNVCMLIEMNFITIMILWHEILFHFSPFERITHFRETFFFFIKYLHCQHSTIVVYTLPFYLQKKSSYFTTSNYSYMAIIHFILS